MYRRRYFYQCQYKWCYNDNKNLLFNKLFEFLEIFFVESEKSDDTFLTTTDETSTVRIESEGIDGTEMTRDTTDFFFIYQIQQSNFETTSLKFKLKIFSNFKEEYLGHGSINSGNTTSNDSVIFGVFRVESEGRNTTSVHGDLSLESLQDFEGFRVDNFSSFL